MNSLTNTNDEDEETSSDELRDLIAYVFGDTDEEEEFEGFDDEGIQQDMGEGIPKSAGNKDKDIEEKKETVKDEITDSSIHSSEMDESMFSDESSVTESENRYQEIIDILESSDEKVEPDFEGFTNEDLLSAEMKSIYDFEKMDVEAECIFEREEIEIPFERLHDSRTKYHRKKSKRPPTDFEIMELKKKEERNRKRKNGWINFEDQDLIKDIIKQMRDAAEEDKTLSKNKKAATKKLKILPAVLSQMKKEDLEYYFLNEGVLDVLADWLRPLSDDQLPHQDIRCKIIKQLSEFRHIHKDHLLKSGIAKVLNQLRCHKKETKGNKEIARKLNLDWSRTVFNLKDNYYSLTMEERKEMRKNQVGNTGRKKQSQEKEFLQQTSSYTVPPEIVFQNPTKKPKESFEKMLAKPENIVSMRKGRKFGRSAPRRMLK